MATRTILVQIEENQNNTESAIYNRVSSSDQKYDLDRQIAR